MFVNNKILDDKHVNPKTQDFYRQCKDNVTTVSNEKRGKRKNPVNSITLRSGYDLM